MAKQKDQQNIIICGVGGQGLITLTKILIEAATDQGLDAKTSELHGLSQRGGSVETHIRFGKKIDSPLVKQGGADLIIAIEAQEALKASIYASKESETNFLINDFTAAIPGKKSVSTDEILKAVKKSAGKVHLISATKIAKEDLGNPVLAGMYLLALGIYKGVIPLKPDAVLGAVKKIVPEKFFDINKKTFELAEKNAKD